RSPKSKIYLSPTGAINIDNRSEIIDYMRSLFDVSLQSPLQDEKKDTPILKPGRFWASMKYLENKTFRNKENWFKEWYDSYIKWIKSHTRLSIDKGYYIGEEAYKSYKEETLTIKGHDWE